MTNLTNEIRDILRLTKQQRSLRRGRYSRIGSPEGLESRELLSSITVTTLEDVVSDSDGHVSLREAVAQANQSTNGDTIRFDRGLISNGRAKVLVTEQLTIDADSGRTRIQGLGASNLSISAQQLDRIFSVEEGGDLYLAGITLEDGRAETGGAILNSGKVRLRRVKLRNNAAIGGAGRRGRAGYNNSDIAGGNGYGGSAGGTAVGGAVANFGMLTSQGSWLAGNQARGGRGGDGGNGGYGGRNLVKGYSGGQGGQGGDGGDAHGGAIFNAEDSTLKLTDTLFARNAARSGDTGRGGNGGNGGSGQHIVAGGRGGDGGNSGDGGEALGGAIFNDGFVIDTGTRYSANKAQHGEIGSPGTGGNGGTGQVNGPRGDSGAKGESGLALSPDMHGDRTPIDRDDQISEAISLGEIRRTATVTQGRINWGQDVDTYEFTVEAGQIIRFDVDSPSRYFNSYVRIFTDSGEQVAANNNAAAPDESRGRDSYIEHSFDADGTFYVAVSAHGNGTYNIETGDADETGETSGRYSLDVAEIGRTADFDDQMSEAHDLRTVRTYSRTDRISDPLDVDMFKFGVVRSSVRITVTGHMLRLFDTTGRELRRGTSLSFNGAGTYFLSVSGIGNDDFDPQDGSGDKPGQAGGYYLSISSRRR